MLNKVAMIGVPMDLGGGRRGVDMGPSAIRIAGLEDGLRRLGLQYEDRGNLAVPAPESREPRDPRARSVLQRIVARDADEAKRARAQALLDALPVD